MHGMAFCWRRRRLLRIGRQAMTTKEYAVLESTPFTQPEQQQKPVAIVEVVVPHLKSIIVKHILDAPFPNVGDFFYTSPPAIKPWVGLTTADLDEIDAPIRDRGSATIAEIYRAIEAKLREKNGDAA